MLQYINECLLRAIFIDSWRMGLVGGMKNGRGYRKANEVIDYCIKTAWLNHSKSRGNHPGGGGVSVSE